MSNIELDFQPDRPYGTKGTLVIFGDGGQPLHSDRLDMASSRRRKELIKEVCKKYPAFDQGQLEAAMLQKVAEISASRRRADEHNGDAQENNPLENTPKGVRDDALGVLKSPDLFKIISQDIEKIGVAGEEDLALMVYIVMTSRLLDKPLSALIQGASASGKSYVVETLVKLMPPEAVIQAHDFTEQSLYYLPAGSLRHKVVVSGERLQQYQGKDGHAEDNTKAFREMVGSGELRKAVTVKGPDGKPRTELIHQPGPIAYLESTTATTIHDEDFTRLLPLVTDESKDQTCKVIEALRREAKGQTISEADQKKIIERHRTMQRLLRKCAVVITYIDSIHLPENNVATRRIYQQFRYVIVAVAVLRQYQKTAEGQVSPGAQIEADEIDYGVAHRLMKPILARKYSPLNQQSRDLLRTVQEEIGVGEEFTQADCQQLCGVSNTTVRRRLGPLVSAGIVAVTADSKPYKYKVVQPDLAKAAELNLPSPDEIAERIALMKA